uniref:52 kDa repressor of the inhibitor of the protein kinaselike [Bombyx mori] n=1 Tax=Lepeophtheirus salmonis TaxID=72036 RepID=A0A0K2T2U1_LEPSM
MKRKTRKRTNRRREKLIQGSSLRAEPSNKSYVTRFQSQGDQVRNQVLDEVKKKRYYYIIFDSALDITHIYQMSQVLRYVKLTDNEVKVEESILLFTEMKGKMLSK